MFNFYRIWSKSVEGAVAVANRISVLLTTEGTYPFHQGGVSTWCDMLLKRLKTIDFYVMSILTDPFVTQKFELPPGTELTKVPLWGTEEPNEHLSQLFSTTYLAKKRTDDSVVEKRFLPLFVELVKEIISRDKNAYYAADVIVQLYDLFTEYDYKMVFKSQLTWNSYKKIMLEAVANPASGFDEPDIYCLIQSLGWVYRFFNIINTPIPKTSVSHSSAAAFCSLPCVVAKLKYGTPFLLTEHGVYLREQYLALSKHGYPSFLNTFLIRLVHTMTNLSYTYANQISPVCEYNTRWEAEMTNRHERIEVIYNGVDHGVFTSVKPVNHERPTVVTVARVDPIKDLISLLKAAAMVRKKIPNVRFLVYGSVTVPQYYERCLETRDALELQGTVEFLGHTSDMVKAYESGDVVALTSISEAFPYTVVEAMLAGKPVVTTDVGGIPEAVGTTGIVVPPSNPEALATGLQMLLNNPELCRTMGEEARERALNLFTLDDSLSKYLKSYIKLAIGAHEVTASARTSLTRGHNASATESAAQPVMSKLFSGGTQHLYAERAFALLDMGETEEAKAMLRLAIEAERYSHATPVLVCQLAELEFWTGHTEVAHKLQIQSEALATLIAKREQRTYAERGYGLKEWGYLRQAAEQFRYALQAAPDSSVAPVLCYELSSLSYQAGKAHQGKLEEDKAMLISALRGR